MNTALLERLQEVRGRLRRVELAAGICRTLLALLSLLAAFFLIDWLVLSRSLDPGGGDRAARGLLDLCAIALLSWVIARTVLSELRRPRSDDALAMRIEASHPVLDGRLISAVQLVRRLGAGAGDLASAELIAALIKDAQRCCQGLDFGTIIDLRRLRRVGLAAGGLLLLAVGLGLWQRDLASALLRRVLLVDAAYPTAAAILQVTAAATVGQGDPYPIELEVDAGRRIPEQAEASILSATSPALALTLDRQPGVHDGRVRFLGTLPHALEDFSIHLHALDARWPNAIRVHVVERPMLRSVSATCTFPAYLGRAAETAPLGDLRVPVGTTVHVHALATKALEQAALVRQVRPAGSALSVPAEAATPLVLDAAGTALDGDFAVMADGTLSLRLLDREGFANADPIVYAITAVPDRAPCVSIQFPGHDQLATRTAQWPLRFTVTDDHGIVRGWIKYTILAGDEAASGQDAPAGATATGTASTDSTAGTDSTGSGTATAAVVQKIGITGLAQPGELAVHREVVLNLAKLGVSEGQRVVYWIEVEDNCRPVANVGSSPKFTFTVVDQASLNDRFEHDKSQILGGIENLRDRQAQMKNAIDTVRKAAP